MRSVLTRCVVTSCVPNVARVCTPHQTARERSDAVRALVVERRAYNCPRSLDEAVAELRGESGKQFDPRLVEAFLDTLPDGR